MTRLPPAFVARLPPIVQEITGAKVKAEEQSDLLRRRLHFAERRPGQHRHRRHDGIDFLDPVHAFQGQHNSVFARLRPPSKAREAALWNDRDPEPIAEPQRGGNLLRPARPDDREWPHRTKTAPI